MKNVITVISFFTNNAAPTNAVVPIPSFKSKELFATNTAVISSVTRDFFSTFSIFLSSPFKYCSSQLLAFSSFIVSIHSCTPSKHSKLASFFFLENIFWTFPDVATINNVIGNTQSADKANFQFTKNKLIAIIHVDKIAPTNCPITWEKLCSRTSQSFKITFVKSVKFFFSKNDNGNCLNRSASDILLIPLAL